MKAIILQHEERTPPGTTTLWLKSRRIPFEILTPSKVSSYPSSSEFDLLFICGGRMNVDQEDQFSWLGAEKNFIRESLRSGKKSLGLCLGGQLLAEALGASVQKHPHWEVGWQPVQFQDGQELFVFQYHAYSFSIPEGADLMASNSICRNQAFKYRDQVLGFQFHPETTEAWAIQCAENPNLPTTGFTQPREEIVRLTPLYQARLQNWYFDQLDLFLGEKHK